MSDNNLNFDNFIITAPDANVLLVDDNPMNLRVIIKQLKKMQVHIDVAHNGDKCLDYANKNQYDIILLDHLMPVKDGIETLKEMRVLPNGLNETTPVVCLTANTSDGAKDLYLSEGFNAYLAKPVDFSELEKIMVKFISQDKVIFPDNSVDELNSEEIIDNKDDVIVNKLSAIEETGLIDTNVGIKNNGTIDDYLQILKIYYESIDEFYAVIETYYANKDYANYTIKVHSLKSSSRIIGAVDFGEQAQALENAGKSNDIEYIDEHHASFMQTYMKFKKILSDIFNVESVASDKPMADRNLLDTIYRQLKNAAEDMDCNQIEHVISKLNGYNIPDSDEKKWNDIIDAIDRFDYMTVIDLIDNQ